MQPHRSRYWLNASPLDPAAFREQAEAVCDLYQRAGELAEHGIHVVSVDENSVSGMPGVVKVVVKKNFVGVVAAKPWQAMQAAGKLNVNWSAGAGLPRQQDLLETQL